MNDIELVPRRRIDKPLGVFLVAVFDFVAVGLFPLITIVWVGPNPAGGISFISFVFGLSLAIFTMGASIWAWVGDNPGRLLLLALVTLTSLIIIINNIILMTQGEVVGPDIFKCVGNIIRGLFWIGINWWYLNRKPTLAYYKQQQC